MYSRTVSELSFLRRPRSSWSWSGSMMSIYGKEKVGQNLNGDLNVNSMKVSYFVVRSDLDLKVKINDCLCDLTQSRLLPPLLGRTHLTAIFVGIRRLVAFALGRMLIASVSAVVTRILVRAHFKFGIIESRLFKVSKYSIWKYLN